MVTEVETEEDAWNDRTVITNVDEIVEEIESTWPGSSSEDTPFHVIDPCLNGDPQYLRVKGHRKGRWYDVIDTVKEMGLELEDMWQFDNNKEDDVIVVKVVPSDD